MSVQANEANCNYLNAASDSNHRPFHQPTQYHMVVRSSCIPPANTVFTWWSDHRAFHQPTQCHMVVKSSCIPPANTVPHGGQIIVHSTSQHSATWWSGHCAFHQPTRGGQTESLRGKKRTYSSAQIPLLISKDTD